jgi:hypothetical protein
MSGTENRVTNREFAKQESFQKACAEKGIQPTKRQAAKFRRQLNRWAKG